MGFQFQAVKSEVKFQADVQLFLSMPVHTVLFMNDLPHAFLCFECCVVFARIVTFFHPCALGFSKTNATETDWCPSLDNTSPQSEMPRAKGCPVEDAPSRDAP